ncbi:MAG: hypothetical protein J1E34_03720 [Oscillospiraceae bacterium]|nr:hypothetical protein [Oscillospiraceae bacterium]
MSRITARPKPTKNGSCGGFERPVIEEKVNKVNKDDKKAVKDYAAHLIRELHTSFGLTYADIGKIVGIDRMQINGYAVLNKKMSVNRAMYIVSKLKGYADALNKD